MQKTRPFRASSGPRGDDISAEEDSLAENAFREPLHPLDQFRAMQVLAQHGDDVEAIAAHFMTSTTVVRQRLKLASVSPRLHAIYADDGMTLEQLMAFSVCDDHQRQEQVWDLLAHSYNRSPSYIRSKLTEDTARASDKRARFVTVDAYIAAGGGVMRDLFEEDCGGWLTDPALLDRLVAEKLAAEDEKVHAEGWKWVATAVDLPWGVTHGLRAIEGTPVPMSVEEAATLEALQRELEGLEREWADASEVPDDINARLNAIGEAIAGLSERPMIFEPGEMARAGAFVSIDADGSSRIERGYVRPEDEAAAGADSASGADIIAAAPPREGDEDRPDPQPGGGATDPGLGEEEAEGEATKPLPERLVAELTAWRTLALQDALAQRPAIAFAMVLHALVLRTFYRASCESCVELTLHPVSFAHAPADLRDSAPARAMAERHALWTDRLPKSDRDLWATILELDSSGQGALFAHCASQAVNAQQEIVPKYDNGRLSRHGIERRVVHSDVLARAVDLDLVEAGWRPTAAGYFSNVTKSRILADVAEARGEQVAEMIGHLKKVDMAREAERLLQDARWLPEPMRTPEPAAPSDDASRGHSGADTPLPAFLDADEQHGKGAEAPYAVAAE